MKERKSESEKERMRIDERKRGRDRRKKRVSERDERKWTLDNRCARGDAKEGGSY